MSVLHITCKHWLGHVTVYKAETAPAAVFLSAEISKDITLNLPGGVYVVRQSAVEGKVSTDYSVTIGHDTIMTLEIAWKNTNIATLSDQKKVRYDGVSAGLHYAFGIKHGNCFVGDVRHELPLLDSIVLGTDIAFVLLSGVINEDGDTLTLTFNKNAHRGSGYVATSLNVDTADNNDIQLSYVSGDGTPTLVFSLATIVQVDEVANFDFDGFPDCIVDEVGISLSEIIDFPLLNNSIQSYTDIILWDSLDGHIVGNVYTATVTDYPKSHTAVVTGIPALSTTNRRVGWSSLHRPMGINGLVYEIPEHVPLRIGVWHYATTSYSQHPFWLRSSVHATIDLRFTIYYGTSLRLQSFLIPAPVEYIENFPINTWRFFELVFDPANRKIVILINGVVKIDYTHSSEFPTATPINRLYLSEYNTNGPVDFNDNLIVSTDITRDLYALAMLESCPRI